MSDNTKRGIVFALILLAILFALGLRVDHPKSGLKNALGSASSSIAVYWHHSKISPGEKIVVLTDAMATVRQLLNVSTEPMCSICFEDLVSLVSVPCGHTF